MIIFGVVPINGAIVKSIYGILLVILLTINFISTGYAYSEEPCEKNENVGVRPAGAPIIKYSSDFGFMGGGNLSIYNYSDGAIKPYKYLYRIQTLVGTTLDTSSHFFFDAPEIFGTKFRPQVKIAFEKINRYNYFGIGNDAAKTGASDFNKFERTTPSLFVNVIRKLRGNFYLIGGYLYEHRIVRADSTSRLKLDAPLGSNGGRDSELRIGVAYNSTDSEAMPTKGTFTDFYAELPQKWLGSTFNYERFTFTNRNYVKLFEPLVWASRFVVKSSIGDVPFYEMAKVGGYIHFDGLGGGATVRGVEQSRIIDKNMYIFNEELRFFVTNFYIGRERFDIYVLSFADFGRVFSGVNDLSLSGMHFGGGGGLRLCWNKNFMIAPDVGFSSEGYGAYLSFRNIF